jgi:hypothetical protein
VKIDAALEQMSTLAHMSIEGKYILDGGSNYLVTGQTPAQLKSVQVYSLGSMTSLSGTVTTAATKGSLTYTGAAGNVISTATFTLTGKLGSATISVAASDSLSSAATQINNASYQTGVTPPCGDVRRSPRSTTELARKAGRQRDQGTLIRRRATEREPCGDQRRRHAAEALPSSVDGNRLTYVETASMSS